MNDLLFDIPIYLRSHEEFDSERRDAENRLKKSWGGEYALGKKISISWPPWEYSDIIGYYKILINSSANPRGLRCTVFCRARWFAGPQKNRVPVLTMRHGGKI